jgi:hypothetical protein
MPDVSVTLNSGTKTISVNHSSVQASVSKGERVEWTCSDGAFQIAFKPGSDWPNPPAAREKDGVWSTASGPFNRPHTTLHYAVNAAGYTTLDPDIEVIP